MTTRPKPLFYETAKCVALYMDANVRLQLYFRCPMFQTVHRNQTLRIRDLKVRPDNFEINGTIYKLGVITQYMDTPNPRWVTLRNSRGGLQTDVDVYGLPLTLNMADDVAEVVISQREIMWLRKDLQNKKRGSYETFKQILSEIEEAQSKLKVRQNRINISPSSCRNFLQLTVITGEVFEIERVDYKKQFKLTREYIEKRIFSNMNIQVGNLEIGGYCKENDLQLPLEPLFRNAPQGDFVKPLLSIREGCLELGVLKVTGNVTNALASLRTVLSATVSLKQLRTGNQSLPDDPLNKTSQLVSIFGYLSFTALSSCPNNRTHLDSYADVPNFRFTYVVNKWMESDMSIGTYYSMGIHASRISSICLEKSQVLRQSRTKKPGELEQEFLFEIFLNYRLTKFPECIIIPMKNHTELNVCCDEPNEEEKEYCSARYIMKLKWQPRGITRGAH